MILILQLKKLRLWKSKKLSKVTQYYISTPDLGYRSKDEFQHTCFMPWPTYLLWKRKVTDKLLGVWLGDLISLNLSLLKQI